MKKQLELTDDLRKYALALIKGWGVEVQDADGLATLKTDDLITLILEVGSAHGQLHLLKDQLIRCFPVIKLYQAMRGLCEEYHDDFPSSEEATALADEITKKSEAEQRAIHEASTQAMLQSLFGQRGPTQ